MKKSIKYLFNIIDFDSHVCVSKVHSPSHILKVPLSDVKNVIGFKYCYKWPIVVSKGC